MSNNNNPSTDSTIPAYKYWKISTYIKKYMHFLRECLIGNLIIITTYIRKSSFSYNLIKTYNRRHNNNCIISL